MFETNEKINLEKIVSIWLYHTHQKCINLIASRKYTHQRVTLYIATFFKRFLTFDSSEVDDTGNLMSSGNVT